MAMALMSKNQLFRLGTALLSVGFAVGLEAAEAAAPSTPSAKPAATAVPPAEAKPEEALLFTSRAGKRRVLGRMDAEGRCKAYLGKAGAGWSAYPDPRIPGDDHQAVSSPDGRRLALISSRSGAVNLWLLSADAREWRQLSDDDGGIMSPAEAQGPVLAFSPDSKRLAFVRRGLLWVMDLSGEEPHALTQARGVRALAWSPDARWLAYLIRDSLRRIDANGAADTLLSDGVADEPSLAWHPDAKSEQLFFLGGGLRRVDSRRRVTLLAASSSRPNALAPLPGGKLVALLAPSAGGRSDVHMASISEKGAALAQVTQEGAESVLASAAGKNLFFMRDGAVWRCENDGRKARPLGSVKVEALRVASLPPLKGVCP